MANVAHLPDGRVLQRITDGHAPITPRGLVATKAATTDFLGDGIVRIAHIAFAHSVDRRSR